jgi:hypothetical protein
MRERGYEAVQVHRKRYGYFPEGFMWRGRRYCVSKVEKSWTHCRRNGIGRMKVRSFRVRCAEGIFDLHHDLGNNIWHLSAA